MSWHWHKWGPWQDTRVNYWGDGKFQYSKSIQKRYCLVCGKKRKR